MDVGKLIDIYMYTYTQLSSPIDLSIPVALIQNGYKGWPSTTEAQTANEDTFGAGTLRTLELLDEKILLG